MRLFFFKNERHRAMFIEAARSEFIPKRVIFKGRLKIDFKEIGASFVVTFFLEK